MSYSHTRTRWAIPRYFWYALPLLALLVWSIIVSPQKPLSDFAGYYFGSKAILQGNYMAAYDMELLNQHILQEGYKGVYVSYAPFPPFTALIYSLFYGFSVTKAKLLYNILSSLLLLFSLRRAIHFFKLSPYTILWIPLLFWTPITNNIFFGQAYIILFCLLLEGYMFYQKAKIIPAALCWGIAILFKLFPGFLFFFLLIRKQYKQAFWLGVFCALLLLLSIGISGWEVWHFYYSNILPKLSAGELNNPFTVFFQSAFMMFKNIFVYDSLLNPHAPYPRPDFFTGIMILYKGLILSVAYTYTRRQKDREFLSMAVCLLAGMLISPNGSTYSLILLLLTWIALWTPQPTSNYEFSTGPLLLSGILLFLVCNLSIQPFLDFPVIAQYPRLYLLLILLVVLVSPISRSLQWKPFLVITGLLWSTQLLKSKKLFYDPSAYLLDKELALFIDDYTVKEGELRVYAWEGERREYPTGIHIDTYEQKDLELKNNQIYYKGKIITHSADWKRKPGIINHNTLIYLSDKKRGVGFYTLRKLSLNELKSVQ